MEVRIVILATGYWLLATGYWLLATLFMTTEAQYTVHPQNWLPLPGVTEVRREVVLTQHVDENDKFSKATVAEFYARQGYGVVALDDGTRIPFHVGSVTLVGEKSHPSYIQQGVRVGYDLGVTSRGPRISTLKVY